jgi:hypothetical protein
MNYEKYSTPVLALSQCRRCPGRRRRRLPRQPDNELLRLYDQEEHQTAEEEPGPFAERNFNRVTLDEVRRLAAGGVGGRIQR